MGHWLQAKNNCKMADLLWEKEQEPAPQRKNRKEPKCQGNEDAELIFVGVEHANEDADILFVKVISNAKAVISKILNRVTPGSGPKSRKVLKSQDTAHAWKPATHLAPTSKAVANLPVSPPESRSTDNPIVMEHSSNPGCYRSPPQVTPHNYSDLLLPWPQHPVGVAISVEGKDESPRDSKRRSPSDVNSGNPKWHKLSDGITGECPSDIFSNIFPVMKAGTPPKGVPTSLNHVQNGALSPLACANNKTHFDLMNPDVANSFERLTKTDFSHITSQNKTVDVKKGNVIMLLCDFYYGQHKGDGQPDQKTHTNFKCVSCLKVLNNVKFMNHMKQHLELEKERGDSWESHTTCQHCHRQFPTPYQLQCHIESVHIPQEHSSVCKICELSFETDQVLLQHMKDNHKRGEMPYLCQLCNYRSSFFADVEVHFRACHENTKNLLCPFCLKIFKKAIAYVNHCWRHWNKRVFRCSKCRLQFLTLKERMVHGTQNHESFKNPEQLEGLPPETKVIIQTSFQPGSRAAASITVSITDNK